MGDSSKPIVLGSCSCSSHSHTWTHSMAKAHADKLRALIALQIQNNEFKNSPAAAVYAYERPHKDTKAMVYIIEARNINENDVGAIKHILGDQTEAAAAINVKSIKVDLKNTDGETVAFNQKIQDLEYPATKFLKLNYIKALISNPLVITYNPFLSSDGATLATLTDAFTLESNFPGVGVTSTYGLVKTFHIEFETSLKSK